MTKKKYFLLGLAFLLAAKSAIEGHKMFQKVSKLTSIHFYHPYRPIFPIDPRSIQSVGDQVLSEHLFAFHSREAIKSGFQPVLSDVQFDHENNRVTLQPRFKLLNSDGAQVSMQAICDGIRSSFEGTQHLPYRSILKSTQCTSDKVIVQLSGIPTNLKFLFTLPDLSIFEPKDLPIPSKGPFPASTGPYKISEVHEDRFVLRRNPHYPAELTANDVDEAVYHPYRVGETHELVGEANPATHHLIYFNGSAVIESDLEVLQNKGYRLQIHPSEWVAYVRFHPRVTSSERQAIGQLLDEIRPNLSSVIKIGQAAFSLVPSDRPFGLEETEYLALTSSRSGAITKKLKLGALSTKIDSPIMKAAVSALQAANSNFELVMFGPGEWMKMDEECDFSIELLGISPADPLNHLAYLMNYDPNFKSVLTEQKLTALALIEDAEAFAQAIKAVESEIVRQRIVVPIAHFPGIVAEAPNFERDESLAWSWGTQAWTYRIR